jgi:PhzF family phenazine biosynthesis protein
MNIPIYHVDAFCNQLFRGNSAAVCLLEEWLPEDMLQAIAAENNLPATAFLVRDLTTDKLTYAVRWFRPEQEIPLCGHGSLAAAYVIFNHVDQQHDEVIFNYPKGTLTINRQGDKMTITFARAEVQPCEAPDNLLQGLGLQPVAVYKDHRYVVLLETEAQVRQLKPDVKLWQALDIYSIIITAAGDKVDFVSRNFYPCEIPAEDQVTGSAHCALVPFWAARLGKTKLHALQVSPRGGELWCELQDQQVLLSGQARLYMQGNVLLFAQ